MALDFKNTRFSFDRRPASYSKVRGLIGWFRRNNRWFYPSVEPGAYFNVGCGPNVRPGFVNVDRSWWPGVDICCDIVKGMPVPDGTLGGVYSEHCLEHLSLDAAKAFLADCRRAMAPGASIRLIVPDFEIYARAYVDDLEGKPTRQPNEHFVNRTGVNLPVALINELFYGSGHRFHYDFRALAELLRATGFTAVDKCAFGVGRDPRLLIDDAGRVSESLYVEAVKPAR